MRYLIVLLAVWILSGCVGGPLVFTYVPEDWSSEELAELSYAATFWNEKTDREAIKLEAVKDNPSVFASTLSDGTRGLWSPKNRTIRVDLAQMQYAELSEIFAHEMGHALGMNHSAKGLMGARGGGFFLWTPEDEAQCLADSVCLGVDR